MPAPSVSSPCQRSKAANLVTRPAISDKKVEGAKAGEREKKRKRVRFAWRATRRMRACWGTRTKQERKKNTSSQGVQRSAQEEADEERRRACTPCSAQ
eukprot:218383-Rhodomonas_salina.1